MACGELGLGHLEEGSEVQQLGSRGGRSLAHLELNVILTEKGENKAINIEKYILCISINITHK